MSLTLVIGNKNYSSWSMRPWMAMKHFGLQFEEIVVPLGQPDSKARFQSYSAAGKVPVLIDGDIVVWESLAILDYLDEFHARGRFWPKDRAARACARSIACEMHAGFQALRSHCPMNIRRDVSSRALTPEAQADVARIDAIWADARQRFGREGSFLFGGFSAADAMYAPVVNRLHVYDVPVSAASRTYMNAMLELPAWQAWEAASRAEPWVLAKVEV